MMHDKIGSAHRQADIKMDRPPVGPRWLTGWIPPYHTISFSILLTDQLLQFVLCKRFTWSGSFSALLVCLDILDILLLFAIGFVLHLFPPAVPFSLPHDWLLPSSLSAVQCRGGGFNSRGLQLAKVAKWIFLFLSYGSKTWLSIGNLMLLFLRTHSGTSLHGLLGTRWCLCAKETQGFQESGRTTLSRLW